MLLKKIISVVLAASMLTPAFGVFAEEAAAVADSGFDKDAYYTERIQNFEANGWGLDDLVDIIDSRNIQVTDKEFFGVWNGTAWTDGPYFDYDSFPALAEVEAAAKAVTEPDANDAYLACKEALLEYYRDKYSTYNFRNTASSITDETLASYEAYMDNFVSSNVFGRFNLPSEPGWTSIDVKTNFTGKRSSTQNQRYVLAASRRDGRTGVIDSIESAFKPYVEAEVNGILKRFYAVKDTYVKVGSAGVAYGASDKLYVEDSVNAIDLTPNTFETGDTAINPVADENKYAFLEFDFTELDPNDQITSARMYIHGSWVDDGIAREPNMPTSLDYKSVYILPFTQHSISQDLDALTYTTFKSYNSTGSIFESLDGEPFRRLNQTLPLPESGGNYVEGNNKKALLGGGNNMKIPFNGYLATENEAFAFHALRVLLCSIKENGDLQSRINRNYYIGNDNYRQVAFETRADSTTTPLYLKDLIESSYMSPDVFTAILKFEHDTAEVLIECWKVSEEVNNWGGYNCTALQYYSMFFPEFKKASAPLLNELADSRYGGSRRGGWAAVEQFRREYKMDQDFPIDPVSGEANCVEVSSEYTYENIKTLLGAVKVAEMVGADYSSCYNDELIAKLENAIEALIRRTNPRFGDWQTGDASPYTMNFANKFNDFLKLKNDNEFINYFTSERTKGSAPDYYTYVNDAYPRVNFRNSWETNAVAGLFQNVGGSFTNKRSHTHNDDLSLTVAAYGQYLLVDPMQHNYEENTSARERWLSSTRAHNTVEINDTVGMGANQYYSSNFSNKDYFGDDLIVPIQQYLKVEGKLFPENREVNNIYDFVRGQTFSYDYTRTSEGGDPVVHNAMGGKQFEVLRDVLFLRKGYFIVTDYINPYTDLTAVNTYKQGWHVMHNANPSVDKQKGTFQTNNDGKPNVVVATVKDADIKEVYLKEGLFTQDRTNFNEGVWADEANEITESGTFYGVYEQQKAGIATFNTLIYPTDVGKKADIITEPIVLALDDDKADAFEANITDEQGHITNLSYYTLYDTSLKADITFGDYKTNGTVALAEKENGKYSSAILRNGSNLKRTNDEFYLVYSDVEVPDIGVEWVNNEVRLASADTIDLTKLTVYTGTDAVTGVYFNDEPVEYKKSGRYIYFGTTPVIDDSSYTPPASEDNTAGTTPPQHGTTNPPSGTTNLPSGTTPGGTTTGGTTTGGSTAGGTTTNNPALDSSLQNHWAKDEITHLITTGIVTGDQNGNLNLASKVTRAEFITMIVRGLGLDAQAPNGSFNDVSADAWYAPSVEAAKNIGLVSGDNGSFYPLRDITREEMTKILVDAYEYKYGEIKVDTSKEFTDNDSISSWAKAYIDKATSVGLMLGLDDGSFGPKQSANRDQAMVVLYRLLNKN